MIRYRLLLLLLSPLILLHLVWRSLRDGGADYFRQRLGLGYGELPSGAVWFHCASVGEVKCVLPLLQKLHSLHPQARFLLTSNTPTSRQIVLRFDQPWLQHRYCPLDFGFAVSAFLDRLQPAACCLFETELWPGLITACARRTIRVRMLNARLSDSSMQRAGWLRPIYRPAFAAIEAIFARNETDAGRFISLGADAATVTALGDLKLVNSTPGNSRQQLTARDYVLAVSTHEDEEIQLCRHCLPVLGDQLLVIAPRHPERGAAIASSLRKQGLNIAMHSQQDAITDDTRVYLLDAVGLLDAWFGDASCVIMGGSFAAIGGHNIMEPMAWARAVVYGPSMHNFREMHDMVMREQAAVQVDDYARLADQLRNWIDEADSRRAFEDRARALTQNLNSVLDVYAGRLADLFN